MLKLCELIGGSHLYGINTPASDEDVRYVFANDELNRLVGIDRYELVERQNEEEDSFGYEIRHYLSLLRKTNTQVMDILYDPRDKFTLVHPLFERLVLDHKDKFVDSDRLYHSLKGYIQGERARATGKAQARVGKRKDAIAAFGYSPKNMTQLLRLTYVGIEFFRNNNYVVCLDGNPDFVKELVEIKTTPEKFNVSYLSERSVAMERFMDASYDGRDKTKDSKFDEAYANRVLFDIYNPMMAKHYSEMHL